MSHESDTPTSIIKRLEPVDLFVRVGNIEVELGANGIGSVVVDGKSVPCRSATIEVEAGKLPKVILEVVPR